MATNTTTQQSYNPYQSNPNIFGLQNLGVGSNKGYDVPALPGQQLSPTIAKPLGNAVEWIGDKLGMKEGNISEAIAGGPTQHTDPLKLVKTAQAAETTGGNTTLSADILRNKFGFNDQSVIDSILNSQSDRERYERELSGGGTPQQKSAVDIYKESNPYSDITPEWNPADFENQLNEIYNQALGFANQQKSFAEQMKQGNIADIEGQYGVSKGTLDTSRGQAMGTLQESDISARQRQEQSLDAIRRLYNEMQMGYNQRFGGASSAGEAARALAGQEQQRQSGTTRQATSDALRQIEAQKVQVEENYRNTLLDLENKKNTAINEANRNFQSAILAIDKDLGTAANEKSLAKMNLLKEYKTDLFNIKQQEAAFKANLETMKAQADMQTQSALKQLQTSAGIGTSAINTQYGSATIDPRTGLAMGSNQYNPAVMTGQISKDELQNYLGQIGQSRSDIPLWMQR